MMKRWLGISLFALVVTCSWVMANDYVDDVYVWVPRTTVIYQSEVDQASNHEAVQTATANAFTIEFLDDSITRQNPDTVVRAIIRR